MMLASASNVRFAGPRARSLGDEAAPHGVPPTSGDARLKTTISGPSGMWNGARGISGRPKL